MNKCKTCKYWSTYDSTCSKVGYMDRGEVKDNEKMFYLDVKYSDDWGLSIEFITNPDFGCNQWEEYAISD